MALATARAEAPPRRGQPRVEVRSRGWYNPELDYRHYMVPGILVQLLTIVGTLLTALNIASEYHRFRRQVADKLNGYDREVAAISAMLEAALPGGLSLDEGTSDEPTAG